MLSVDGRRLIAFQFFSEHQVLIEDDMEQVTSDAVFKRLLKKNQMFSHWFSKLMDVGKVESASFLPSVSQALEHLGEMDRRHCREHLAVINSSLDHVPMVLGLARQPCVFCMKYYDVDEMKMPIRDGEWFFGKTSTENIWISPFTRKKLNHRAALLLSFRYGSAEADISLGRAFYLPRRCSSSLKC